MEKDRKASADRERLGGKPENQSLAGPLLSSTPDIKMDLPPPPVECFPDDEPSADASTPAKSWSKTGWASFRWNMGPADVKALIEPEPQREVTWHPGVLGEGDRLIVPSGIKAFGRDVSTTFNFKKDRLTSIRFGVTCDDVDVKNIECERWRRDVMANFDKQYGKSRCVKETDHERCHWDYPDKAWVSLKRYGDADKFVTLSLELEDSALRPTRVVDHMKRKGAPQKAWSKFGWNGFQWGMGIVDAQRRLSDPNGNMQANRELVCHAIQKEIGTVECKLERDFHKFEILGMIPSLVFKFSAGRLFSIQLHFPEGLDRLASWEKAEKLRQLLTDKYGKNSKDWSSSKEKNKSMNVDWDTNDINISFYARQTESSAWMVIRYENPVKGGGGEEPSDSDSTRSKL
ncbi:MAG: hypothetical protein U1E51_16320 [Candidatus Binatia bacterium]|nr:hypothetical protein [Candidatus Binatia bacterium]